MKILSDSEQMHMTISSAIEHIKQKILSTQSEQSYATDSVKIKIKCGMSSTPG